MRYTNFIFVITMYYHSNRVLSLLRVLYDTCIQNMFKQTENHNENNENNENTNTLAIPNKKVTRYYVKKYSLYDYLGPYFEPVFVIDNIFIGSAFNAASSAIIHKFNIKYIVNVTTNISNYFSDVTYVNVKIEDNNSDSIDDFLIPTYDKLVEFKNKHDGNTLVHCYFGASRSVCIMLFYLMKMYNMELYDALEFMKTKRYLIHPTESLLRSIAMACANHC